MLSCAPPPRSLAARIGHGWRSALTDLLILVLDGFSDAEPVGHLAPIHEPKRAPPRPDLR